MAYSLETVDIVKGSSFSLDAKGFHDVLRIRVDGVPAPAPAGWRADVAFFLAGQGYSINAPHPKYGGCVISRINGEPFATGKTSIFVNIEYGPSDSNNGGQGYKVTVSGATGIRTYNVDKDLKLITIDYTGSEQGAVKETDSVQLQVIAANTVITYEWRSQIPPLALNRAYRRKLNKTAWNGFDPQTVLCRSFDAEGIQGSTWWNYSASFEWDPGPDGKGGWRELVVFRDRRTGKAPADIDPITRAQDSGKGWKWVDVYETAEFNQLPFPTIG